MNSKRSHASVLANFNAGAVMAGIGRCSVQLHVSRPEQIEEAFAALGKQVDIQARNVA